MLKTRVCFYEKNQKYRLVGRLLKEKTCVCWCYIFRERIWETCFYVSRKYIFLGCWKLWKYQQDAHRARKKSHPTVTGSITPIPPRKSPTPVSALKRIGRESFQPPRKKAFGLEYHFSHTFLSRGESEFSLARAPTGKIV